MQIDLAKQKLIQNIIRLQQDFEVLTDRSNALQHQNEYFQAQLQDLQSQLQNQYKQQHVQVQSSHQSHQSHSPQWPLYLKIQGQTLPQQPGQFIKFQGQDNNTYVQFLQLVQHVETSPDGKTQTITKEEYMVVQQPLEMFQSQYGNFSTIGTNEHASRGQEKKQDQSDKGEGKK